jgi:D-alanyl-D-alanine carboxypeptidase
MRSRPFTTSLAIIMAVGLLATACGDDDDGAAGAPTDESSTDQNEPDTVEVDEAALQGILDQWRTDVDTYGATLSIRVPGHDDIHLASGVDDRDITTTGPDGAPAEHTETPMPTDGTYPVLSITKTFVAATALQLVDDGRLSLDEPVQAWLPELPNADQITLRMLLGYTSGLGQWEEADYVATLLEDLTRSFTPEEVLAKHLEYPPIAPPGGEPSLGDAGYISTGLLIERELGQDLATTIQERFTSPLGLDDTVLSDGSTRPTRHGWFSLPDNPDQPLDTFDQPSEAVMTTLWAGRGMTSSSTDMLDWGEALFSGEVLGEATTATLLEMNPAQPPPLPDRYFALGATGYCTQPGCAPDEVGLVGAPGSTFAGWGTQLAHHLDSGTTIITYTNTSTPQPSDQIDLPLQVLRELGLA